VTLLGGAVVAYLIGAIPVGFLIARAFGITDIRTHGSGNIGASNVLRTAGRAAGVLTLAGDIVKGYLAATAGGALGGSTPLAAGAGAVAAIIGNCWSIFLLLRGGKGVATGLGALLTVVPLATVPAALVWLGVALGSRYVSLASVLAALSVPVSALAVGYPLDVVVAGGVAAGIVVGRHHQNLARLMAGTERRLGDRRRAA
jgi:glycerol-3-phosphate acyltransferase PlsY